MVGSEIVKTGLTTGGGRAEKKKHKKQFPLARRSWSVGSCEVRPAFDFGFSGDGSNKKDTI